MTGNGLDLLGCDSVGSAQLSLEDIRAGAGVLKRGSKGAAVADLQRRLGVQKADGDFGPETEGAARAFQVSKGLKADGVVGRDTAEALLSGGQTPASSAEQPATRGQTPPASVVQAKTPTQVSRSQADITLREDEKTPSTGTYLGYVFGGLAVLLGGYALWPKKAS